MDIKHELHKHMDGTDHKMFRIYKREKVNGKYLFVPIGWMCSNCSNISTINVTSK